MLNYFNLVKDFFDKGFWTIQKVRDAVRMSWITEAEFKEITGETY